MPFGSQGFLEERCSESGTVPEGLNTFISLFCTEAYLSVQVKFGMRDLCTVLFSICEFCENRRRETVLCYGRILN